MEIQFAHLSDLSVDVTAKFQARDCQIHVTRINSEEAGLRAVLFDTNRHSWAMLSLATFRLENFLYEVLNDVNHTLTLLPHRIKFPLKSAYCLLNLHANHLMEFLVFFGGGSLAYCRSGLSLLSYVRSFYFGSRLLGPILDYVTLVAVETIRLREP